MRLLGFSGKKQSGKDSCARFLKANAMFLWPGDAVETYYFGGPMKDFASEYLGIPKELCWGTNEQKNTLTNLLWENLPHYYKVWRQVGEIVEKEIKEGKHAASGTQRSLDNLWHRLTNERAPRGQMTVRQVLQQIGEEMFLDLYPNIWTDKFKHIIREDYCEIAVGLVADPRKPEQIVAIKECGGKAVRLMRAPFAEQDEHISEKALDQDRYDWNNFDAIIDNRHLSVPATNQVLYDLLVSWDWLPKDKHPYINWNPVEV